MISLHDHCGIIYDTTLSNLLSYGIQGTQEEREKFIAELSLSFQQRYAELGMPYGASEQDLIRYLQEHSEFDVEG